MTDEMRNMLTDAIRNNDESVIAMLGAIVHKEEANEFDKTSDKKILVIGDVKFTEEQLKGFLKSVNISKDRLDFKSGYKTLKQKSIRSYQYNNNYALILVGAIPHSIKDKGCFSSIVAAMESEEGWPNVIRLGSNGLKGTLSNAKQAIINMMDAGVIVAA